MTQPPYEPSGAPYVQPAGEPSRASVPVLGQRPQGTNGLALAGFILGLLPLPVVGAVFSVLGLRRIRQTGERGRGLATAGLVLSCCWTLLIGWFMASTFWPGEAGDGQTTAVSNVRVGQCFDADLSKSTLMVVQIADCAGPHAGEAYAKAKAKLTGMGSEEQELTATEECAHAFESFVGKPFQQSSLEIVYVALDERERSDGNILCMLAGKPGQQLTGSMRNSKR